MIEGNVSSNQTISGQVSSTAALSGEVSSNQNIQGSLNNAMIQDYEPLNNKPQINGVVLEGNKTTEELGIADKEDKQVYCEINVNFNTNTGDVSLRNWITEDPYQVIDEANKKGKPAILKMHLYANDNYMETIYTMQSIYSDTWWGSFKYFLAFVDNETIGYIRLNKNGSTTLGLKKY